MKDSCKKLMFQFPILPSLGFSEKNLHANRAASTGHGVQRQGATNGHGTLCQGAIMTAPNDRLDGQMVKYGLFVFIETGVMSRIASCWFLPRKSNKHDFSMILKCCKLRGCVGWAVIKGRMTFDHDVPIASSSYTHLDAQALGCHRFGVVIT